MEDREDDCKVLILSDVGAKFGVVLSNLPKFHVSRVEKTDDEEWLESVEEDLVEIPLPGEEHVSIEQLINKLITENNHLVKENSTCILPNSKFKIKLVEGADAWFMWQYDIPVELRPIVRRRMKEWWDAGWVQLFGNGKNIYNSAWLAVNKVSGGRIVKDDTQVCIDYRPGNLRTG